MTDVSVASYAAMYAGWLVLLVAGIVATFMANLWGEGWIWASLVLFAVLTVYMGVRAGNYMRALRTAIGLAPSRSKPDAPAPEPISAEELDRMLRSPQLLEVSLVGSVGLIALILLMVLKPF